MKDQYNHMSLSECIDLFNQSGYENVEIKQEKTGHMSIDINPFSYGFRERWLFVIDRDIVIGVFNRINCQTYLVSGSERYYERPCVVLFNFESFNNDSKVQEMLKMFSEYGCQILFPTELSIDVVRGAFGNDICFDQRVAKGVMMEKESKEKISKGSGSGLSFFSSPCFKKENDCFSIDSVSSNTHLNQY